MPLVLRKESQIRKTTSFPSVTFGKVEQNTPGIFQADLGSPNLRTQWQIQQINTEFKWGTNSAVGGPTKFELSVFLISGGYKHLFVIEEVLSLSANQLRGIVTENFISDDIAPGQNVTILFEVSIKEPLTSLELELLNLKIEGQILEKFPYAH